ncbi:MAG: ATP-dependent DNA helicase [Gammaproteobacteria bacterium]
MTGYRNEPEFSWPLSGQGSFVHKIPGFVPRQTQQALADAVGRALQQQEVLVAEAGTGTGKTFAYLVPALLSGKRVLISTGTRALQDQLYHRDLPAVTQVLGRPVKTALLKGRANYLCRHRLALALHSSADLFGAGARAQELACIRDWAGVTRSGDIAELATLAEYSPLWPQVTSTVENCLGQKCPEYAHCWVLEARRHAQEAELVVINHHLLLADMLLKEEGFGALLPGVDCVIVDEAHQLPDIASQYFGVNLSSHRLQELLRDSRKEYQESAADAPGFERLLSQGEAALAELQQQCLRVEGVSEWSALAPLAEFDGRLSKLTAALENLQQGFGVLAGRSVGLDNCRQRIAQIMERLQQFAAEDADQDQVRWIERRGHGFSLNLTPVDAAGRFRACMQESQCSWIFLSATLSINGRFGHFRERLGLDAAEELLLGSPFDYEHNALLYLPAELPSVERAEFTAAVVHAAEPVVRQSGGRAFLLFTSHRALKQAAVMVREHWPFPLLVQGEAPRRRLLERFRELGNAVLLGTASFWEGVDVKGPALSVVVIDRLPFASPGDPVLKARLTAIERQGRDAFMEYQLPQAVLALKQGVGRLIRDEGDTGVLMLCDPRVRRKNYGRLFLDSLPPMRRTEDLDEVQSFLARILPHGARAVS